MIRFFTDNPIQLSISELLGRAKWKPLQFEILFDRTHIRSKSCSTICTFARYMVHGYDQTRIHNTRINIVFTRANERYLIECGSFLLCSKIWYKYIREMVRDHKVDV